MPIEATDPIATQIRASPTNLKPLRWQPSALVSLTESGRAFKISFSSYQTQHVEDRLESSRHQLDSSIKEQESPEQGEEDGQEGQQIWCIAESHPAAARCAGRGGSRYTASNAARFPFQSIISSHRHLPSKCGPKITVVANIIPSSATRPSRRAISVPSHDESAQATKTSSISFSGMRPKPPSAELARPTGRPSLRNSSSTAPLPKMLGHRARHPRTRPWSRLRGLAQGQDTW